MPLVPNTGRVSLSNIINCMGGAYTQQSIGRYRSGSAYGSLLSGIPDTTSSISFSHLRGRGIIGNINMTALNNGLPATVSDNVIHFTETFDTSNFTTSVRTLLNNNFSNIYFMDATTNNPAYHFIETASSSGSNGLNAKITIRYPTFSNTRKLNIMYGTSNQSGSGYITFDKYEDFTIPDRSQWVFQNSNYNFTSNGLTFTNSNFAWFATGVNGTQRIVEATVSCPNSNVVCGMINRFSSASIAGSNGWFYAIRSATKSNLIYNFTLSNNPTNNMSAVLSSVNSSYVVPLNSNVDLYAYQSGSYILARPTNVGGLTSVTGTLDISMYNAGTFYGIGVMSGNNVTFKKYRAYQYPKSSGIDTYNRTISFLTI